MADHAVGVRPSLFYCHLFFTAISFLLLSLFYCYLFFTAISFLLLSLFYCHLFFTAISFLLEDKDGSGNQKSCGDGGRGEQRHRPRLRRGFGAGGLQSLDLRAQRRRVGEDPGGD